MTPYNSDWLDAIWTKDTASDWYSKGLLSHENWATIKEKHPNNFYTPNFFLRVGLAIFCLILLFAAMGLIGLILSPNSETGFALFAIFWGIVWIVGLEFWAIRSARHRASGIDDMLLYVGVVAIITGIIGLFHFSTPMLVFYCISFPFLLLGAIRYIDRLMAAAAFFCGLGIVVLVICEIPNLAVYLLPFAGMAFSGGLFFLARNGQSLYAWRHWHGIFWVVESLALMTFYASGNILVIQKFGMELFYLEQVPLAWFFWCFTLGVPLLYIGLGIKNKDRMLLDVGLACIAAAVFTFRYFFNVFPIAWAATIGGAVLFLVAFFATQFLRQYKGGYTNEADSDTTLLQEIEEQLIEQTIANQPDGGPDQKDAFGGGSFGGGGTSGDF